MNNKYFIRFFLYAMSLSFCSHAVANEVVIALLIDDVGNNHQNGLKLIALPGEITLSILPKTPYSQELAELAHTKGKQVMLHLPMESEHHKALGPDGLTLDMTELDYKNTVRNAINSIPHVMGMNNHMGSLLTANRDAMIWLMDILRQEKIFFIDSRTTTKTVAEETASKMGVPSYKRDVFLDNVQEEASITEQFNVLLRLAKKRGFATGIGHPYDATIRVLAEQIPLLQQKGVKLVFVSTLLDQLDIERKL